MNILMMTNTYAPILGGLEKSVHSFSCEFRRRGHKVIVVAPEYKGMPKREGHVVRLPAIQNFNGTDFSVSLPIPSLLSDLTHSFRPDLIHAHHPFLMGDLALRLASQHRLPLVFTYHTMFEQYTHYLPVDNESMKLFVVKLAAGFANLSDCVIAPSESVRELLKKRGVKKPIEVVPSGVDISAFQEGNAAVLRKKFGIPSGSFVAGHIGRLSLEKNLYFLCEAVSIFLQRKKNAHFLIVGHGPIEEKIRAIFTRAGVMDRAHFTGSLQGQALVNAYRAMDVFVFSSQSETQGMVLVEAMAAGVPVVAIDAPGVREVLHDDKNGRLLKDENKKTFSDALWDLANADPVRLRRMQKAARQTASAFSLESCVERALKIYAQVRRRKFIPIRIRRSAWDGMMRRIKTELDMLANLGKAAGAAILEGAARDAEGGS